MCKSWLIPRKACIFVFSHKYNHVWMGKCQLSSVLGFLFGTPLKLTHNKANS